MPQEPELTPLGGMTAIGIAFTKDVMKGVIARVKRLQADGWAEAKILAKMKQEMPGFSEHTVKRFYDLANDRPIQDDFKLEEIVSQKAVAKDTFDLEVRKARYDLCIGTVVRFLGGDWYVKRTNGTQFTIRRIV